jgi:hypothetical protein
MQNTVYVYRREYSQEKGTSSAMHRDTQPGSDVGKLYWMTVVHINDVLSKWAWLFWSAPCNQKEQKLLVGHNARVTCTVQGRLARARYNVGVGTVFDIAGMI